MKLTIGVAGSAAGNITKEIEKKAFIVGEEIAKAGAILITGACPGFPFQAAKGAKSKNGLVVGISPSESKEEHLQRYKEFIKNKKYAIKYFDIIIYTGFGLKGRNVIFIRSCDGVICIGGRTGTLNEFTIAYDDSRPVGVLDSGGITKLIPEVIKIANKGTAPVVYESNPKKLVKKLVKACDNLKARVY